MYQDDSSVPEFEAIGLLKIENNDLNAEHQNLEFEESHNMSKITEEKPILSPEEQQELNNKLINISKNGSAEDVLDLLSKGANINSINNMKWTALIEAAYKGNLQTVKILLDHKALVDTKDNNGNTALIHAAHKGNKEIVQILLDHKAFVDTKNSNGSTALIHAALLGKTDIIKILLDHKALVDTQDNNGQTALMKAIYDNNLETTKILVKSRADVNTTDNDGTTALMIAAYNGKTDIIKILLNYGADLNKQNNDGTTALMIAAYNGKTDIIKILLCHGADLNKRNIDNETAFNGKESTHYILNAHKERLNEIATAIEQESTRTTTLSENELNSDNRKNLVIDATNFNKDNIIDALVYKIATDQVEAARGPNPLINYREERQRIEDLRNDIYDTPETFQAITATVNQVLAKYQAERIKNRDFDPRNMIRLNKLAPEITGIIASYLTEERAGDIHSERGAFRAALSKDQIRYYGAYFRPY